MRIGIDARFYGSVGKGLGRYTQKLIENLEKISADNSGVLTVNKYYIFLRKENWEEYQPKNKNFFKVRADIPWYGIREQIFLPRILRKFNLDLVHFPHFNVPLFYREKFIVTIHDLILFHYPTRRASALSPFFYFFKKMAHRLVIRNAIKKSEKIIAVSAHTKDDIMKRFGTPVDKIVVTHEGIDPIQKAPTEPGEKILSKYGIIKPFLLYVGNVYPHKNLERLILVFREIVKKHPHLYLVLVGKEDYFYKRLKRFVSEYFAKNVIFADFVPDEHLGIVYREALLYVFPSLYEGFGLPPLEAMAKNIPVACSNASCLPEILGESAIYFDPRGMSEMAETIEKAIVDADLRKLLITKGREQIKKYSWEKMARVTLEIYKNISRDN
jgi:glycosyltransferase involved in cell wall biosynthesis